MKNGIKLYKKLHFLFWIQNFNIFMIQQDYFFFNKRHIWPILAIQPSTIIKTQQVFEHVWTLQNENFLNATASQLSKSYRIILNNSSSLDRQDCPQYEISMLQWCDKLLQAIEHAIAFNFTTKTVKAISIFLNILSLKKNKSTKSIKEMSYSRLHFIEIRAAHII